MKLRGFVADLLCMAGLLAIGAALWQIHPAVAVGFGGMAFVAAGIHLERKRKGSQRK